MDKETKMMVVEHIKGSRLYGLHTGGDILSFPFFLVREFVAIALFSFLFYHNYCLLLLRGDECGLSYSLRDIINLQFLF